MDRDFIMKMMGAATQRDMFRGALERIERITWREGDGTADACRALHDIRKEVTSILDAPIPEQPSIKQMVEE